MTPVRAGNRPTGQPVVLVAACNGHRCAALRRLDTGGSTPGRFERPRSEQLLRAAVRQRSDAVLVSVPCLGPCHRGSLAAIGEGVADQAVLTWVGRPTLLDRIELPRRARALAAWIVGFAPAPGTMPASLR